MLADQWQRQWAHESAQPSEGFTVPANVPDQELDQLCDTYATASEEMRNLIRATAAVVCDGRPDRSEFAAA